MIYHVKHMPVPCLILLFGRVPFHSVPIDKAGKKLGEGSLLFQLPDTDRAVIFQKIPLSPQVHELPECVTVQIDQIHVLPPPFTHILYYSISEEESV